MSERKKSLLELLKAELSDRKLLGSNIGHSLIILGLMAVVIQNIEIVMLILQFIVAGMFIYWPYVIIAMGLILLLKFGVDPPRKTEETSNDS